jgi:hypothetical protein
MMQLDQQPRVLRDGVRRTPPQDDVGFFLPSPVSVILRSDPGEARARLEGRKLPMQPSAVHEIR